MSGFWNSCHDFGDRTPADAEAMEGNGKSFLELTAAMAGFGKPNRGDAGSRLSGGGSMAGILISHPDHDETNSADGVLMHRAFFRLRRPQQAATPVCARGG
jgi:hypothetical protein